MANKDKAQKEIRELTLDTLTQFAKRKGFIFQSSEIYDGFAAVYDYGHYGILLKDNIQNAWRKSMLQHRNIYALDSGIFMHPMTWKASGHVDSFVEPEVDCKTCNNRMKADQLLENFGINDADRMPIDEVNEHLETVKAEHDLKCTKCGGKDLTDAKTFDLLVKSNLGSPTQTLDDANIVYLRGETCQGIYLNYKNYIQTMRAKVPFGIAQVGKAFRNEVVARQFIFRTREFEQMEMQMFVHPDDMDKQYDNWMEERMTWQKEKLGLPEESLEFSKHEKLAHYATKAYDINYKFRSMSGKFAEIEGIHARGNWDLSQHAKHSGTNLEYFDQERKEKYIPHVMETSVGLNRLVLAVLDNGYTEDTLEDGTTRLVLKIKHSIAPVKAAVFPLTKDEKLQEVAEEIYANLSDKFQTEYDLSGSIGKRYRRQDEIGTPFCITVDFDSLEDKQVTIRDRDTLEQVRLPIDEVVQWIEQKLS